MRDTHLLCTHIKIMVTSAGMALLVRVGVWVCSMRWAVLASGICAVAAVLFALLTHNSSLSGCPWAHQPSLPTLPLCSVITRVSGT